MDHQTVEAPLMKTIGKWIQFLSFVGCVGAVVAMFSGTESGPPLGILLMLVSLVGFGLGRFISALGR